MFLSCRRFIILGVASNLHVSSFPFSLRNFNTLLLRGSCVKVFKSSKRLSLSVFMLIFFFKFCLTDEMSLLDRHDSVGKYSANFNIKSLFEALGFWVIKNLKTFLLILMSLIFILSNCFFSSKISNSLFKE